MLRTKPDETRSSIACQVVSRDMVVSISRTPSSSKVLEVLPTPECVQYAKIILEGIQMCMKALVKIPNKIP